mmetsp:Transcript_31763/g.69504  ORF Transcript_31763/g.69504 Transcript_31763/m.69504 type:complete len:1073 (+) Transcript_31763:60-3278(+)
MAATEEAMDAGGEEAAAEEEEIMAAPELIDPTLDIWSKRQETRDQKADMIFGNEVLATRSVLAEVEPSEVSKGYMEVTLKVPGNNLETLMLQLRRKTKVADLKAALSNCLAAGNLEFVMRSQNRLIELQDTDAIVSLMWVKGIKSFKPESFTWPHPTMIIGAGYRGLKACMMFKKAGNSNFMCYERNDRLGGNFWLTTANKTSRLQTEIGSFHVWYGMVEENLGLPDTQRWGIWPGKQEVLEHFQHAAEAYGVLPYIKFKSDVTKIDFVGDRNDFYMHYWVSVKPVGKTVIQDEWPRVSVIYSFPGGMTRNRIVEYPGEDQFGGHIGYGTHDDIGYDELPGSVTAILGHGAFAIENIRTCVEYRAKMIYLVTRRKNLSCPSVPCWFVNQAPTPVSADLLLDMLKPMYKMCKFGDPYSYSSVEDDKGMEASKITQSSSFGIGDVAFLAVAYGRCEIVEDTVKRMTKNCLHLTSGKNLEGVTNVCKALGLVGDFAVDKLHRMKQMVGWYCDGDWRRVCLIDEPGISGSNFIDFSVGIHTNSWMEAQQYIHGHPREYYDRLGQGFMQKLPVNLANEKLEKPAYVCSSHHSQTAALVTETMFPKIGEQNALLGDYKYHMYHRTHGIDEILEEARASWDKYQETWKAEGFKHEYIEYPYSRTKLKEYCNTFTDRGGAMQITLDGPGQNSYANVRIGGVVQEGTQQAKDDDPGTGPAGLWAPDEKWDLGEFFADDLEQAEAADPRPKPYAEPVDYLPPIPRNFRLPDYDAVPAALQKNYEGLHLETRPKVSMRVFVFYGAGDNWYTWAMLAKDVPEFVEMAVYEWPAHGSRDGEEPLTSLDAITEDAFLALKPALEQHAKGGRIEGAPFAFIGHSIGTLIVTALSKKIEEEMHLEPSCVVMMDRGAPHQAHHSEYGQKMRDEDPWQFIRYWAVMVYKAGMSHGGEKGQKMVQGWCDDAKIASDARPIGWYKFKCPLLVLRATDNVYIDLDKDSDDPETKERWAQREKMLNSPPGTAMDYAAEQYLEWKEWAEGDFVVVDIKASHMTIKTNQQTLDTMWGMFFAKKAPDPSGPRYYGKD